MPKSAKCECECVSCRTGDHCGELPTGCKEISEELWADEMIAASGLLDQQLSDDDIPGQDPVDDEDQY